MHPKSKTYPTAPTPSFPVRVITILCFVSLLVSFVAYRSGYWEDGNMSATMLDSYAVVDSNINPQDSPFIVDEPIIAPSSKSARVFEPTIMSSSKSGKVITPSSDTNKPKAKIIMGSSKSAPAILPSKKEKRINNKRKKQKKIIYSSKSGAVVEPYSPNKK